MLAFAEAALDKLKEAGASAELSMMEKRATLRRPKAEPVQSEPPTPRHEPSTPRRPRLERVTPAENDTPFEKTVNELVSTEHTYVLALQAIVDIYLPHMQNLVLGPDERVALPLELAVAFQDFTDPVISAEDIRTLFGNVKQILALNVGFLADLETAQVLPKEVDGAPNPDSLYNNVGRLFLKFVHFFKMYGVYCAGYEASANLLGEFLTPDKFESFKRYCETALAQPHSGGSTLASLLIQPIQRVPRYILLLKELNKHAPPDDHPVHEKLRKELEEALKMTTSVAERINDEIRQQASRDEILALSAQFMSDPQFVGPSRRLIRQGAMLRETRSGNKQYHFFLFNDFLAYAELTMLGKFKLHRKIPLDDTFTLNADVVEYRPTEFRQIQCLEIISSQKSFRVFLPTSQDKIDWIEDIEEQLTEFRSSIRKRTETQGATPRMVPHHSSDKCSNCSTAFTLLSGPVNCCQCGQLFCKSCTKARVLVYRAKRGTTGETESEREQTKEPACEACAKARHQAARERLKSRAQTYHKKLYDAFGVDNKELGGQILEYNPRTQMGIQERLRSHSEVPEERRGRSSAVTKRTGEDNGVLDTTEVEPVSELAPELASEPTTPVASQDIKIEAVPLPPVLVRRTKPAALSIFAELEQKALQLDSLQAKNRPLPPTPSPKPVPTKPLPLLPEEKPIPAKPPPIFSEDKPLSTATPQKPSGSTSLRIPLKPAPTPESASASFQSPLPLRPNAPFTSPTERATDPTADKSSFRANNSKFLVKNTRTPAGVPSVSPVPSTGVGAGPSASMRRPLPRPTEPQTIDSGDPPRKDEAPAASSFKRPLGVTPMGVNLAPRTGNVDKPWHKDSMILVAKETCKKCKAVRPDQKPFCAECGASFEEKEACKNCHLVRPDKKPFCIGCGNKYPV